MRYRRDRMLSTRSRAAALVLMSFPGCTQRLDVGWNDPPGESSLVPTPPAGTSLAASEAGEPGADAAAEPASDGLELPFPTAAPLIIANDGPHDNWQGEQALVSVTEGRPLVGLLVNASPAWPELDQNLAGWEAFVVAARSSGFDVPTPVRSTGSPLVRPPSGRIEDTTPNGSEGAAFIVEAARTVPGDGPPLVVIMGGRLTDVADAYLLEPEISQRIYVVASLGARTEDGARMARPNGEMDAWADTIVTQRLRYVQVSDYYAQSGDLDADAAAGHTSSELGAWIKEKQPLISGQQVASDQVALLAATAPGFARLVERVRAEPAVPFDPLEGPALVRDEGGAGWLVSDVDPGIAAERLRGLLDALD